MPFWRRRPKPSANEPEPYRRRVAFLRAGLDYTRLVLEIRSQMTRWEESDRQDAAAETLARDHWREIEQIAYDYPYSVHWGVIQPRPGGRGPIPHPFSDDAARTIMRRKCPMQP